MILLYYEQANTPVDEMTVDTATIISKKMNALVDGFSPADRAAVNQAYMFPPPSLSCSTPWEVGCYLRFFEIKSREVVRTKLLELVHHLGKGDLIAQTAQVDEVMSRIQ